MWNTCRRSASSSSVSCHVLRHGPSRCSAAPSPPHSRSHQSCHLCHCAATAALTGFTRVPHDWRWLAALTAATAHAGWLLLFLLCSVLFCYVFFRFCRPDSVLTPVPGLSAASCLLPIAGAVPPGDQPMTCPHRSPCWALAQQEPSLRSPAHGSFIRIIVVVHSVDMQHPLLPPPPPNSCTSQGTALPVLLRLSSRSSTHRRRRDAMTSTIIVQHVRSVVASTMSE